MQQKIIALYLNFINTEILERLYKTESSRDELDHDKSDVLDYKYIETKYHTFESICVKNYHHLENQKYQYHVLPSYTEKKCEYDKRIYIQNW